MREELLDELRHEDDQGLWEVVWSLNTMSPDVELSSKIALARSVVVELLSDGLIELRQIEWPSHGGRLLTEDQLRQLRQDDVPWHDPEATDLLVQINALDSV